MNIPKKLTKEQLRKIWRENSRKYRENNKDKLLAYGKKNYARWNERHKEYQRLYYAKKRNLPKELILKNENFLNTALTLKGGLQDIPKSFPAVSE